MISHPHPPPRGRVFNHVPTVALRLPFRHANTFTPIFLLQADIQTLISEKLALEQSLHKANENRSIAGKTGSSCCWPNTAGHSRKGEGDCSLLQTCPTGLFVSDPVVLQILMRLAWYLLTIFIELKASVHFRK
jgi:hypothetical protein